MSTLTPELRHFVNANIRRKRLMALAMPAAIVVYLIYVFFAFDVPGLAQKASLDKAKLLVSDSYSYKTHVLRDNRSGDVSVTVEGEAKGRFAQEDEPSWVVRDQGDVRIELGDDHFVVMGQEAITFDIPDYGQIIAVPSRRGVALTLPQEGVPEWINASKNRVKVQTKAGRLTVTKARTEVFRYAFGWDSFWFTVDSAYYDLPLREVMQRAVDGEASAIWNDFWHNDVWLHSMVYWAIFETFLMAFIGTFGAAVITLPLAFLAARNFAPLMIIRGVFRRLFDFLRGVDSLIWTVILARAFGPGPMTGALAILVTDTGSFGKIFSEALENVDNKQIEGVQSTGAARALMYRFAVIPQVMPVLLSQVLYFFESNTRSATVIGAITGGGIGLLLTQAMVTQKDWEEVSYYIILIVILVMAMDWLSGKLRSLLIKGA